MRTYGERCGKVIETAVHSRLRRFGESKPVAAQAPIAALRLALVSSCKLKESFRVVFAVFKLYFTLRFKLGYEPFYLVGASYIFVALSYVRVIEKHCNIKVSVKIFKDIRRAWRTARVQ